MNQWFNPSL